MNYIYLLEKKSAKQVQCQWVLISSGSESHEIFLLDFLIHARKSGVLKQLNLFQIHFQTNDL